MPIQKLPIRRLNFDDEIQEPSRKSIVPVKINRISRVQHFSYIPDNSVSYLKGSLKSSPIQMFNSFLSNSDCIPHTSSVKETTERLCGTLKVTGRRICCNCKKSNCLKLYCECFRSKKYCSGCNCVNCYNIRENEEGREKAMKVTLERNPIAFKPKFERIGKVVF